MSEMNGGPWRIMAIALITMVTGVGATWASLGTDKVSRADFEALRKEIVELKVEQAKISAELEDLIDRLPRR
jgi:hypothetical protein